MTSEYIIRLQSCTLCSIQCATNNSNNRTLLQYYYTILYYTIQGITVTNSIQSVLYTQYVFPPNNRLMNYQYTNSNNTDTVVARLYKV